MNFGTTAAYCECGLWRGPNTLKKRSTVVSSPSYTRANATQNRSAASFVTPYGESGSGGASSFTGRSRRTP